MSQKLKAVVAATGGETVFWTAAAGLKGAGGGVHFCVWHTHASDDSKMQKEMEFSVAYVSWNRFVCVCVCVYS